jgi:hypothetical protein
MACAAGATYEGQVAEQCQCEDKYLQFHTLSSPTDTVG